MDLASPPVISRRDIVRAYDPLLRGSLKASFQSLRARGVVSPGIRRPVRRGGGKVEGSVHLYSQLNRQAVQLFRHGKEREAQELAREAERLEQAPDFRVIVLALASLVAAQDRPLAVLNETPWAAIEGLATVDEPLRRAVLDAASTMMSIRNAYMDGAESITRVAGWVAAVQPVLAEIQTLAGAAFMVQRAQLAPLGLDREGAAVELEWDQLGGADFIVSTGPAVEILQVKRWVRPKQPSIFSPGARLQVTPQRWRRLEQLRDGAPVAVPPLPVPLPPRS
jgi:hypothetical protein